VLVGTQPAAARHVRGFWPIFTSDRIAEHQRQRRCRRTAASAAVTSRRRMYANVWR